MKKNIILFLLVVFALTSLVACGNEVQIDDVSYIPSNIIESEGTTEIINESSYVPKSEQEGTAGSNIPLKDNFEEAKYQIEMAIQKLFEETYGNEVVDARIYVEKMYTTEDEQEIDPLKEMNLGPNEVAFIVRFDLKPAEGADVNMLSIPNGEYDEESGWIKNNTRVGVLRPDESGNRKYMITDYGTGW